VGEKKFGVEVQKFGLEILFSLRALQLRLLLLTFWILRLRGCMSKL
jgi:hypothetical protein